MSKLLFADHSRVMSPMVDGVPVHGATGSASNQGAESGKSQMHLASQGFKQHVSDGHV